MAAFELVGFLVEVVALFFAPVLLLFFPFLEVALHLVAMTVGPELVALLVEGVHLLVDLRVPPFHPPLDRQVLALEHHGGQLFLA